MTSMDRQIDRAIKILQDIARKEVPAATSSAINKTLKMARTRVVEGVSKKLNIPKKHIRKRTGLVGLSTVKKQRGRLISYLHDLPVSSLMKDPKPRGRKDRRAIKVAGRSYPGAFINAKRGSKSYQVFKRDGKDRYPIKIQKIEMRQTILDVTKVVINRVMTAEHDRLLAHELSYRIGKYANIKG